MNHVRYMPLFILLGLLPCKVHAQSRQLEYDAKGNGDAVVLVHGFTLDRRMWDVEFSKLAEEFRVIRYDLRGHGASPGVTKAFSNTSDLKSLLDDLDVTSAHLVGLSLGGWIATDFAILNPERVTSLTLIDPFYPSDQQTEFDKRIQGYFRTARNNGLDAGLKQWIDDPLFAYSRRDEKMRKFLADVVLVGHSNQKEGALFLNTSKHRNDPRLESRSLRDIKTPTLLLIGIHDIDEFHEIGSKLQREIPKIKKLTVPDAGHMANLDNPEFVWNSLVVFLRSQGRTKR